MRFLWDSHGCIGRMGHMGRIDHMSRMGPMGETECTVSHIMVLSLRSKWAAGPAAAGPAAHFERNPPGRASWLFFRVAHSTRMNQIWALRSRLEKQLTDPASAHARQLKGFSIVR